MQTIEGPSLSRALDVARKAAALIVLIGGPPATLIAFYYVLLGIFGQ